MLKLFIMSCCYYLKGRPNCTATRILRFDDLPTINEKTCVKLKVKRDEPFIYHPTFQCNDLTSLYPKVISIYARDFLISFRCNKNFELFYDKYILEFIKINNIWKLRFRIDVCRWIEYWRSQEKNDFIVIAKHYAKHLHAISKEENNKLSNFPDRIVYPVPLQHLKYLQCYCGQYLTSLRIPTVELRSQNFAVVAPSKAISEIIIMPNPGEVTHYSNADIIKCSQFWKDLFLILENFNDICECDSLGNYISFNFGDWESENLTYLKMLEENNDKQIYITTKHAHARAHVSLSSVLIEKISSQTFTYNDLKKLKNCTRNPNLDNIIEDRKNIADYLLFLEQNITA